jgi:hypothetical protein
MTKEARRPEWCWRGQKPRRSGAKPTCDRISTVDVQRRMYLLHQGGEIVENATMTDHLRLVNKPQFHWR